MFGNQADDRNQLKLAPMDVSYDREEDDSSHASRSKKQIGKTPSKSQKSFRSNQRAQSRKGNVSKGRGSSNQQPQKVSARMTEAINNNSKLSKMTGSQDRQQKKISQRPFQNHKPSRESPLYYRENTSLNRMVETEGGDSAGDQSSDARQYRQFERGHNKYSMQKPSNMSKRITAEISNGGRKQPRDSKMTVRKSQSYDQQSYDDEEIAYQLGDDYNMKQPYDLVHQNGQRNWNEYEQNFYFNQAIKAKLQKDQAEVVGAPYYMKRQQRPIDDDPNDFHCTFKPALYAPLGAPKDEMMPVDPLSWKPVKNIKHSPVTKTSMDYHYKRLFHARQGPKVYRDKQEPAGGGPFYQKVACEGTKNDPLSEQVVEVRKKQLQDVQMKFYKEGLKDNDPRFNMLGGNFRGAQPLGTNIHMINLPDKSLDRKRLKQKDLKGRNFDNQFKTVTTENSQIGFDRSYLNLEENSRSLDRNPRIKQNLMSSSFFNENFKTNESHTLRRSIQNNARAVALNQPLANMNLTSTCYSKGTIADRFANKGIRNRTEARTMPLAKASGPTNYNELEDRQGSRSLMNTTLNQRSQVSEAFGATFMRNSMNNNYEADPTTFIRGVPKFVESTHGPRYANEHEQMEMDNMNSTFYESANFQNSFMYQNGENLAGDTGFETQRKPIEMVRNKTIAADPNQFLKMKRQIRNHSFNPNQTFSHTLDQHKTVPMTKLLAQSNDSSMRKQNRKVATDLHKIIKENRFMVVEGLNSAGDVGLDSLVNVNDLINNSRSTGQVAQQMSPGLVQSGQHFTVISNNTKKEKEREKKDPKKKKNGSQISGSQEFDLNDNASGLKQNDGLVLPHGFYNFTNMPDFAQERYHGVHAKHKKRIFGDSGDSPQQVGGGELASEQMAELAQEMLETDQQMEIEEHEDPVLNMNNLKDIPFNEFLILHKIFPKIFMLELDTKFGFNRLAHKGSPSKLTDDKTSVMDRKNTLQSRVDNQEQFKLKKALTRRQKFQQAHTVEMQAKVADQFQQQHTMKDTNRIKIFNALDKLKLEQKQTDLSKGGAILESSNSGFMSENLETSNRNFKTSLDREIESPIKGPDDEQSSKSKNASQFVAPHPLPLGEAQDEQDDFTTEEPRTVKANSKLTIDLQRNDDARYFQYKGSETPAAKHHTVQNVPIRVFDSNRKDTSNNSPHDGKRPRGLNPQVSNFSDARTMRTLQTKKSINVPKPPKLTSYETCLQKYTTYLRTRKYDRCEVLMKQGSAIFTREELSNQFTFNQGVLCIAQQKYQAAIEKFMILYEAICKNFKMRPSAQRLEGCNVREAQKFAILQNLVIAYMMREMEEPSRSRQTTLYQLLRTESLIHIRFTQSTDELNLFKMATFVKQYIKDEQIRRYTEGIDDDEESEEKEEVQIEEQPASEKSSKYSFTDTKSKRKQSITDAVQQRLQQVQKEVNRVDTVNETQEDKSESEEADEVGAENIDYDKHFQRTSFKKPMKLQHPQYTRGKKFEFLARNTPIITGSPTAQVSAAAATIEDPGSDYERRQIEKDHVDRDRQKELKMRVNKVMNLFNKKDRIREQRLGIGQAQDSSNVDPSSPYNRMPLSEADSIFDEVHQQLGIAPQITNNQDSDKDSRPGTRARDADGSKRISTIGEDISAMDEEAQELGVDLSYLYSHKKPKEVQNVQQRMILDILKKQNANKQREKKYRNMDVNRIQLRKKFEDRSLDFSKKMNTLDEYHEQMQTDVEVDMIRKGGGIKTLDPLQSQYKALATSISQLCQEPNIADIIIDYVKEQKEINDAQKSGRKESSRKTSSMETGYSAALEVLIHATRHIFEQEDVSIDEKDRAFLVGRINQVKEMFEEELRNPDLITKNRGSGPPIMLDATIKKTKTADDTTMPKKKANEGNTEGEGDGGNVQGNE